MLCPVRSNSEPHWFGKITHTASQIWSFSSFLTWRFYLAKKKYTSAMDCGCTRRGPLTTISEFIPNYTHLQPWLNRVCWGYNYLILGGPLLVTKGEKTANYEKNDTNVPTSAEILI